MLRHLTLARTILFHKVKLIKAERSSILRVRHKTDYEKIGSREPCPPSLPPPVPPPKDDSLFWGLCALAMCSTAFAVFAKHNPEVRDWMSLYFPWFDDIIAFAYEENYSYSDYFACKFEAIKDKVADVMDLEKEPCVLDSEGNKIEPPKKLEKECEPPKPPIVVRDICEIERCLKENSENVYSNIYNAKQSCITYNQLVEESMKHFSMAKLRVLNQAMIERKKVIETSLEKSAAASRKFEELIAYMDCGVQAPTEQIAATRQLIENQKDKINKEDIEYKWANDKALACDKQLEMVAGTMNKFSSESKAMYPMLDFEKEKPTISGDPDAFLYHAYRYIRNLTCKLAMAQTTMTEKTNRGINVSLAQDEKSRKSYLSMIDNGVKKARADIDNDLKKRMDELKKRNDDRLKNMLDVQQFSNDHEIQTKCAEVERHLTSKFDQIVSDKVAEEKRVFEKQRADMAQKLDLIQRKLHEHLIADKESTRCKELWSAGNALLNATKKGEKVVDVAKELKAVEKAGKEDELVNKLLQAIPETVRNNGLIPAAQLRQKYTTMENVARRVALVEEDGGPLPVFILSLLQSALLCLRLSDIPKVELDKPTTDLPTLDTFDLLQRSRYWIDKGEISLALDYVNTLEGASFVASETWRNSAKAYLETRQAAEAVIAHAAAMGLKNSSKI